MERRPFFAVRRFLGEHLDAERPLLLGFSGGNDSMSLLAILLELRRSLPFALHLVHIDHGWRPSSAEESRWVEALATKLALPLHLSCPATRPRKNWEEHGRVARLQVYQELLAETGAQAVLLAHHAQDLAETVFKRLMEGSHLAAVQGMRPCQSVQGVPLWRPLLEVSRESLHTWLQRAEAPPLQDPTNEDPAFLRCRLQALFPEVERAIGKRIQKNLVKLSEQSQWLDNYLAEQSIPVKESLCDHDSGWSLQGAGRYHPALLHYFLRKELSLPRDILHQVVETLVQGGAAKRWSFGGVRLEASAGNLHMQREVPRQGSFVDAIQESESG